MKRALKSTRQAYWAPDASEAPSSHFACASTPVKRTPSRPPGQHDRARLAAEVGDQLAGTPTGHTLTRPMGRRHRHLVIVLLVSHERARLAFRR